MILLKVIATQSAFNIIQYMILLVQVWLGSMERQMSINSVPNVRGPERSLICNATVPY